MRTPTDLPRRKPRGGRGVRVGLVVAIFVAFVLVTSLRGIARFYTDFLWFQEVRLTEVWRGVLAAKVLLAVVFTGLFFLLMWFNLAIAERLAPRLRTGGPDDEIVQRYREAVGPHAGKVRVVVAALFALMAGVGVSGQWNNWLLFRNGTRFGQRDPQFGRDVGFYVFQLPFLKFLVDWAFVAFVIVTVVVVVAHYLNGGIRPQAPGQRVTPQVKAHVSVLLGALALIKAAGYYLQRYELNFSTRGFVQGATYTDVNAQLPALQLLIIISLAAFVLLIANIRRQGWVLPGIAVGLWAFISVIVGAVYPAFIQKVRVEPAENRLESRYIARNIRATQAALGLDGERVERTSFEYDEGLTAETLAANSETIRNVRLWDPAVAEKTYQKLQEIRSYYRFNDIDIDRYQIDGRTTQMLISARELDTGGLPAESWVNRHLQFTHGYGAVLAPANAVAPDGKPNFLVRDVPPRGSPEITQPRIYFGEQSAEFVIVRSEQPEIDFQRPDGSTQTSTYQGRGGVPMGSLVRRAAFALRFGDVNPLISNLITDQSRAIFKRNIADRVGTAAPFLRYDSDPYPVVFQGRIKWIQDAYTTTSHYPYGQRADVERVPASSGLRSSFNYVRNSVKVVVDAYDGSMSFYVVDRRDPVVRTYQKAFPGLFELGERLDPELRRHLRYPEDLFRVQTNMYGRYHITDPGEFYNAADAWNVAQDPGTDTGGVAASTATTNARGQLGASRENRMDPYYLLMRLPDEERESFLILQPFVPASREDRQKNLTAFMTAKSDPENYGRLQVFTMPRGRQIDGPAIVDARISQEPNISREVTLLSQRGSKVLFGNLLVIPVEQSLLYVRPLYVESSRNPLPELKKTIVVYADRVVMGDTLKDSLAAVFGDAPATLEEKASEGATPPATGAPPATPSPGPDGSVSSLLERAGAAFDAAEAALRGGDLAEYQRRIREGVELVRQARAAGGAGGATEAGSPPTTMPTA